MFRIISAHKPKIPRILNSNVVFIAIALMCATATTSAQAEELWSQPITNLCLAPGSFTPPLNKLLESGWMVEEQGTVRKGKPLTLRNQRLAALATDSVMLGGDDSVGYYVMLTKGAPLPVTIVLFDGASGKTRSICAVFIPVRKSPEFKEVCELKSQVDKVLQAAGYRPSEGGKCWDTEYIPTKPGILVTGIWVRADNVFSDFGVADSPFDHTMVNLMVRYVSQAH